MIDTIGAMHLLRPPGKDSASPEVVSGKVSLTYTQHAIHFLIRNKNKIRLLLSFASAVALRVESERGARMMAAMRGTVVRLHALAHPKFVKMVLVVQYKLRTLGLQLSDVLMAASRALMPPKL